MPSAFLAFAFVMRNAAGSCSPFEIIADNLSKAGWSLGYVSAIDSNGRTIGLQTRIAATENSNRRTYRL